MEAAYKRLLQRLQLIGASLRRNSIYCNNQPLSEIVWILGTSNTAAIGPNSSRITHRQPVKVTSTFQWSHPNPSNQSTASKTRTKAWTTATKTASWPHLISKETEFTSRTFYITNCKRIMAASSNVRVRKAAILRNGERLWPMALAESQKWLSTNLESNNSDQANTICLKTTLTLSEKN